MRTLMRTALAICAGLSILIPGAVRGQPPALLDEESTPAVTVPPLSSAPAPNLLATAPPDTSPPVTPDEEPEQPQVGDSGVGYIDSAVLMNAFRFRFDSTYNNVAPGRAEFFWAASPPFGPGIGPEKRVDYQDYSAYLEYKLRPALSVFGEVPIRAVNPTLNDNNAGIADSNVGFKWQLNATPDQLLTFQFRTYIPTGNALHGLGTNHPSLEPALLGFRRLAPRWNLEGELRDWVAMAGTPGVQGNVMRYGLGLGYWLHESGNQRVVAITEFVGWTVLSGGQVTPSDTTGDFIASAAGDTIFNAKIGLRWYFDPLTSLYAGYGQALTKNTWYDNNFRIELRRTF